MQGWKLDRAIAWCAFLLCLAKQVLVAEPGDGHSAQLAYVDPGIGSFIVQAIVAVFAGTALAVRHYWDRIKRALGRAPREDAGPNAAKDDDADG